MSSLRVLQVIGAMDLAGAETMLMNIYRNIDRQEVQFDFLVNAQRKCAYDAEIEELGGQIYRIPYFTGTNYLSYRNSCRRTLSLLSEDHPIVHGHIGAPSAIYLHEAKRNKCYAIAHSHNTKGPLSVSEIGYRAFTFPTRYIADYFFACSYKAGIDRFGTSVVNGNNFSIIPNGIDTRKFAYNADRRAEIRAELSLTNELVIGHVGRFEKQKNHDFLLTIFNAFHDLEPQSKLILVGTGALLDQTRRRVEQLGLSDSVLFLGSRKDTSSLYSAFDVFLFPSHMEGLSVALLEAQASGLPCIISTGNPEDSVMTDSVWRIPLSDGVQAWVERIRYVQGQSIPRSHGAELIRAHGFDVRESAKLLEGFYLAHRVGR